jgi:hypothetical protein
MNHESFDTWELEIQAHIQERRLLKWKHRFEGVVMGGLTTWLMMMWYF